MAALLPGLHTQRPATGRRCVVGLLLLRANRLDAGVKVACFAYDAYSTTAAN